MTDGRKGKFIVLEGTDGSGKTVQFEQLLLNLPSDTKFSIADFPQYDKPSSYFVRRYLNGEYGSWKEVGAKKASLFFALDRFDVGAQIRKWLDDGRLVISNRYVASSMGHQGAKLATREERIKFFRWLHELEYEILEIPRPDLNILLHMPAVIAYDLVAQKGEREYLEGAKRDIHEADLNHLEAAERAYLEMAELFPQDFVRIDCVESGKLLSIEEIHKRVWNIVSKLIGV